MKALITKQQLVIFTGVSEAVKDVLFDMAVLVVKDIGLAQYISEQAVTDVLALDQDLYLEVADTRPELNAFYNNFVAGFVAWSIYSHIVTVHGFNWAQQGIVKFSDSINTSAAVEVEERQNLVNIGIKNKGLYLTKMRRAFLDADKTFDAVVYEIDKEVYNTAEAVQSITTRISPIGKVNRQHNTKRL